MCMNINMDVCSMYLNTHIPTHTHKHTHTRARSLSLSLSLTHTQVPERRRVSRILGRWPADGTRRIPVKCFCFKKTTTMMVFCWYSHTHARTYYAHVYVCIRLFTHIRRWANCKDVHCGEWARLEHGRGVRLYGSGDKYRGEFKVD